MGMKSTLFERYEWNTLQVEIRHGGVSYGCTAEDLYKEFKDRLLREVVALKPGHSSPLSASLNRDPEIYRLTSRPTPSSPPPPASDTPRSA